MKLSNQALGAVMMALQKSLLEQSDIVPILLEFDFENSDDGLIVTNPPVVEVNDDLLSGDPEDPDFVEESELDWASD